MADPAALVQHVHLELGAVIVVTVAGVQQVTAEQLVCLLQKVVIAVLVCH